MTLLFPRGGCIVPADRSKTEAIAFALQLASSAYNDEFKELPPSVENYRIVDTLSGNNHKKIVFIELTPKDLSSNSEVIDGWKTPFRFEFTSSSKKPVRVISAGKDRLFGTKDDIRTE